MSKCKLVGLLLGTMLAVIATLASAPASCQGSAGGNEYWIIIDKPLDSEAKDWKPQFRGPNAKVLEKLSLKPGDTVRVKATGVNDLLYTLTVDLAVRAVPSSTAGLDFFMGKGFGAPPSFPTATAPDETGVTPTSIDVQIKNMRELPTHLVATLVGSEVNLQKEAAGEEKTARAATWLDEVVHECRTRVQAAYGGPTPAELILQGSRLVAHAAVTDKVEFQKRVMMAASIFEKVLAMRGEMESDPLTIPGGSVDCDVTVTLVPVKDVKGEPLTYYEKEDADTSTNIKSGDLGTREKTFTVSESERKAPSGTAGVIFSTVRDSSYALEERDITEGDPPTTTTKKFIVSRGDTDAVTVAVGYLHHFKWEDRYVSFGVGAGQNSLSYFLGLSKSFGSADRPMFVSFGAGLAQVLRLDQVDLGQEYGGTVVPTKKVYRPGWALAVSIQF